MFERHRSFNHIQRSRLDPAVLLVPAMLLLLLGWDASRLDAWLAALMGGAHAFPLREDALLTGVLHRGVRVAAAAVLAWLVAGVIRPTGMHRNLGLAERVYWPAATLASLLAVAGMKQMSLTSCPWDLALFGGHAQWVSHWAWGVADGGPGHCFPAGHASAGFAFLPGWFVLRRHDRVRALAWLIAALAAGFSLGLLQQFRGAHFLSHTLWSAWLCWVIALAAHAVCRWSMTKRD
jgi:membrane-associated PAP2 superfamily phosphatase